MTLSHACGGVKMLEQNDGKMRENVAETIGKRKTIKLLLFATCMSFEAKLQQLQSSFPHHTAVGKTHITAQRKEKSIYQINGAI